MSDTCTLTSTDLQKSQLAVKIKPSNCTLNKYGGGTIKNYGSASLKISFLNKSTVADFKTVEAPENPSILGCRHALELGLLTLNVNNIQSVRETSQQNKLIEVARQDALTNYQVLNEYKECFDKIGRFSGEKYKIKLIEEAKPVIHPPRTVPVHIMPLYQTEIDKMLAEGISPVTGPTDWVNSIVCNIKETLSGKKVRLCLDPKDLNKNIKREHYYSKTIDEILPRLHNKKYFSVMDT